MGAILGLVVTMVMVFGGYMLAGGKLSIILKSLPFEMMMIGGAATGAFLAANDFSTIKHTGGDVLAVSAPTSLAVEVAQHFGVTLCGFVREDRATIYTHPGRIT